MPRITTLGEGFFDVVAPARFPLRTLRFRNQRAAERIGLGDLTAGEWERSFALFEPLLCNLAEPLALRYHGHQFGVYNAQLGDGRGFLYAQAGEGKRLLDLGTKGSGRTPWSRGGDGRLTLKGGVREVLATEMLEALGVETSKSLSLFETGEPLQRSDEPSPTRSCVLTRLSHSHIRFGTFQRLAHLGERASMQRLLEYVLRHYLPDIAEGRVAEGDLPSAFLREVCVRSARVCASWMSAGFVHGVLNSDNMNITGESFDYGPYRFLPTYDPAFTAAYFDHTGEYAYARQPRAVLINLARLAEALGTIAPQTRFAHALREFEPAYTSAVQAKFLGRLGLAPRGSDEDARFLDAMFEYLHGSRVGFDRFFFDWFGGAGSERRALSGPAADAYSGRSFDALRRVIDGYSSAQEGLCQSPYFDSGAPCSLLIEEVEAIWARIAEQDDWALFERKIDRIRAMPRLGPAVS